MDLNSKRFYFILLLYLSVTETTILCRSEDEVRSDFKMTISQKKDSRISCPNSLKFVCVTTMNSRMTRLIDWWLIDSIRFIRLIDSFDWFIRLIDSFDCTRAQHTFFVILLKNFDQFWIYCMHIIILQFILRTSIVYLSDCPALSNKETPNEQQRIHSAVVCSIISTTHYQEAQLRCIYRDRPSIVRIRWDDEI